MSGNDITIIGYGRFGKLLVEIFASDFDINIYDKKSPQLSEDLLSKSMKNTHKISILNNLSECFSSKATIFCVPISEFENTVVESIPFFNAGNTLIDVLSVKSHPKKIFKRYVPKKVSILLTHPMFGPDTVREKGLNGLPIVLDPEFTKKTDYDFWYQYFENRGFRIVNITSAMHDKLAANSQGLTHFVGRLLEAFNLQPTEIDTLGAKKLFEIKQQVTNDSWELFLNLQNYNPYTKSMRLKLGKAYDKIYNSLLPKQINKNYLVFGIQGGRGSFNELALLDYVKRHDIKKYKVKYLYTSERVLEKLHRGDIDFGLFAMHNSVGGVVTESINAIARYKFKIVEDFGIVIRHNLMKRKDVAVSEIGTVMAHDQVLKQCKNTLETRFPNLKQVTGSGNLIDTAKAAEAVSKGILAKNTFILGNPLIANLFNFDTVETNLQDSSNNITSFLVVER
jgi:prephenate dehydrogenase